MKNKTLVLWRTIPTLTAGLNKVEIFNGYGGKVLATLENKNWDKLMIEVAAKKNGFK